MTIYFARLFQLLHERSREPLPGIGVSRKLVVFQLVDADFAD